MQGFLRTIGCYWFGIVLVSLIWSTSIEGMRNFISGLSIWTYLLIWLAALTPGLGFIFLAEKQTKA